MPKTPPPSRRGGSTRRSAPVKVTQPKPWGVIAGSAALGVALVALLVYAVLNQGGGRDPIITDPDDNIAGVSVVADEDELGRNHVAGTVDYPELPPPGGDHNGVPQTCDVYTEAIAPEHAVHSLEHGAVWVTYNDDASEDDIATLEDAVRGNPYRLMSPLPEQESPIVLTAWGRTLEVDSADEEQVDQFLRAYTNGPQTPERGAACAGVTTTGPLQAAPTDTPTTPAPSAGASAAPSASSSPAAQ